MPLSLRRSSSKKQAPHNSPQRTVSTPTLLNRLRSSAFNSSKASLLTSAYDSVRSRTPPRHVEAGPASAEVLPTRVRQKQSVLYPRLDAQWKRAAKRLDKAAFRECLSGAECIGITDAVLGVIRELVHLDWIGSPDVSFDSEDSYESVFSIIHQDVADSPFTPPRFSQQDNQARYPAHTLPAGKQIRKSHFQSLLRDRPRITTTYRPRAGEHKISPYRKISLRRRDEIHSSPRDKSKSGMRDDVGGSPAFSSPVMISPRSLSPARPRSPTPYRMSRPTRISSHPKGITLST